MHEAGLAGQVKRRRGKTTIRVPGVRTAPDLVQRDFNPTEPNRLWSADITYIRTWEGWLYLASVMDLNSRRIVGWSLADHLRAEIVVDALEMAVGRRRPERGLGHHSDRGSQAGFQRSSQHSMMEGCDGQAEGVGCAADGAAGDAFAGTAAGRSARASSAVLGGGRAGRAQRRGRCRGGRVAGRRRPVVSGGWWHAAGQSGSAVGAVLVVRGARGDRGVACRWLRGARGRAAAGSVAVDDLA